MSIETLNSAARAAGFAMAGPEGPDEDATPPAGAWQEDELAAPVVARTAATVPSKVSFAFGDWVKGLFTSGRGAPA